MTLYPINGVVFRPPEPVGHDVRSNDPLWFSRKMLTIFQKNCGTAALDENTARTKARTRAKSYIPNKPDPYGIRFYAVVGWNPGTYLHSINDNRSGNLTNETHAEAYCSVFPELRTVFNKKLENSDIVDGKSPTAMWILQLCHQSKKFASKECFLWITFTLDIR